VPGQGAQGQAQPLVGSGVADGAEQAGHDVELPAQVEIDHVGQVKGDLGVALARDVQQLFRDVGTLDLKVLLQILNVHAGTAGNVEQGPGRGALVSADDVAQQLDLAGIVLPGV
jgi:hypothetical protein